jgi:CelD/BcsL family acetyltransferase involved in cellulose biosynthesis
VPAFVEAEMDALYGNIFSSMTQFRISGLQDGEASTYVARNRRGVLALFLFRHDKRKLKVINECIRLDSAELRRFVDYIFKRFRDVTTICFNAVETERPALPYPCQHYNQLEDIAMALPATPEEYLASLGKNTRRNVRRYGDRLRSSFPSVEFTVYEREAVDEQTIRHIIDFNHARMTGKNKRSNLDEHSVRRITALAQACGLVGVLRIDGRICAGAISYRTGSNYFLDVLAHDPAYDEYWAGILCCYWTICECIKRGGTEFHFLWGRYDYKFTLGATIRNLDGITVYRSHAHMLLNGVYALNATYAGRMRQLKLWMDDETAREATPASRFAFRVLRGLQDVKRFARNAVAR